MCLALVQSSLASSFNCRQSFQAGVLREAACEEQYAAGPLFQKASAVHTLVFSSLTLLRVVAQDPATTGDSTLSRRLSPWPRWEGGCEDRRSAHMGLPCLYTPELPQKWPLSRASLFQMFLWALCWLRELARSYPFSELSSDGISWCELLQDNLL